MADVVRFDCWQAENAVIGSMLIDETQVPAILSAVDIADIQDPGNRRIFQAARALFQAGQPVDPFTVRDKLGSLATDRLTLLLDTTPTSANWREYASLMHEQATLSRIRALAESLADEQTLDGCRDKVAALSELMAAGKEIDAWSMTDAYREFTAAQTSQEKREYITYGIRELDEGTYTERGDVIVIGGEPSSGKTAFSLQIAYHMAKTMNVGFFSLETGQRKLTDRLVSSVAGIDFNAIKKQDLAESDWMRIAEAGQEFTSRRLSLIRGSGMTASQIQAISRSYGFDVIFIDYVQLITPEGDPRAGVTQAVAAISRSLHTFAQSSNTLVVELAQLARPQKAGGYREPDMHDLKETGQLEQDADAVLLLYKPKEGTTIYDVEVDISKTRFLKVAKQKEGRLGRWPMFFDGSKQSFAVMVNPTNEDVMRHYRNASRAAKEKRAEDERRAAKDQQQVSFEEITVDGDEPF